MRLENIESAVDFVSIHVLLDNKSKTFLWTQFVVDLFGAFSSSPSVNTQSCIKGILVVRDFCLWVVWAAGPILKKRFWANYEQVLRAVFSCFQGQEM